MKIALVSPYDFAYLGGVGNHIASLEQRFTRMGHEVKVIAPASKPISQFGDRFIRIGKPYPIPSSDSVIRISISLNLGPEIKRVLEREKFDVIHLHEPLMPMLCSAMLRFTNTVTVGTFHAAEGKPGYNWGGFFTTWKIKTRMHSLPGKIAVSKAAQEYAETAIPGPFEIIPNGIDTKHFNPNVKPIEKYCDGKKNIVFVGRLEFRKGLNWLLKAFLRMKPEMPDCRLIVVGPGTTLRRRYERWIRRHKIIQDDVIFVGKVPFNELPRYYKTADIFCAPATSRESFGIVLLEAMAVGKPIVATNILGFKHVISDGVDGLLVPPCNDKELAKALLSLMADEKRRQEMGAKGLEKSKSYDWDLVANRVLAYYKKTIEEVKQRGI